MFAGMNTKKSQTKPPNRPFFETQPKNTRNAFFDQNQSNLTQFQGQRQNMGFFKDKSFGQGSALTRQNSIQFDQFRMGTKSGGGDSFRFGGSGADPKSNIFADTFEQIKNNRMENKLEQFRQKKGKSRFKEQKKPQKRDRGPRNRYEGKRKYSSDDYIMPSLRKKQKIVKKRKMEKRTKRASIHSDSEHVSRKVASENESFEDLTTMKQILKAKIKAKKKEVTFILKRPAVAFDLFLSRGQLERMARDGGLEASLVQDTSALYCKFDEAKLRQYRNLTESGLTRSQLADLRNLQWAYRSFLDQLRQVRSLGRACPV